METDHQEPETRWDSEQLRFSDKLIHCEKCSTEFIFTVTEQRDMARRGEEPIEPSLCPACRILDSVTGRLRGQVKWFDLGKGYGFITRPDGDDIFVHRSGLAEGVPTLQQEQVVEFDVEIARGRAQAVNVEVVE